MKNIIKMGSASLLSMLLFVGCSAGNSAAVLQEKGATERISINKSLTQKDIHEIIKNVGEKEGWIMTEYKTNSLLAEKINGDTTTAVTINFDTSSFFVSPQSDDLAKAISEELNK
ncbi:hypothetical protein KKG72_00950 [bacterium]|nr:hypothetical protein [bacterium]MBU1994946.1 hypothetical protein [bacterium]